MKMAPLDIVDGSYADEDKSFSAQDTVNYLPTSAEQAGTRTPTMLKTPPGLKPAVLIGVNEGEAGMQVAGPVRGTYNAEGRFFAVAGNQLFQISSAGIAIPLGTVPGVGRVSFSHNQVTNGNEILVNNGNAGYIYSTVTQVFQRITDTSYPGGLKAVFINNRFVQIEPARRYAFNSALANGLEYTALDRFTSETSPDLLVSIESIGNQLAAFSSTTTEWFEDTGASPQPFRSTGIVADKGAAGPFTTAKMDNQLFVLADDGVFYRFQGYNPVRISTKPIEQAIRGKNWLNAFTTVWEDSGFAVCYWTFPDGETWGYDASSGKWHRRESYGFNRWRLNSLTFWQNAWYGGDFQNGRLWRLDWDYLLEGDEEIVSSRAAGVISDNQNRVIHERLELVMNTGMEETVPVEFVDQPNGPSISGGAPDGLTGIAYPGYQYLVTPGVAPVVSVTRRSGGFPPGITMSTGGLLSSTVPTSGGEFSFVIRATDASGLFSELSDTIEIVSPSYATRGNPTILYTSSPYNWDTAVDTGIDATNAVIESRNGKVFVFISGAGAVSSDAGGSWSLCAGVPAIPPVGLVFASGKYFLSVESGTNIYESADGISFSPLAFAPTSALTTSSFAIDETIIVARSNSSQSRRSTDGGITWANCPLVTATQVLRFARNPSSGVILAAQGGVESQIRKSVDDGASWNSIGNPLSGAIASVSYGNDVFMVVGPTGNCATSGDDGGTWVAKTNFGNMGAIGQNNEMIFDGELFCVCGSVNVMTSADGVVWTPRNAISAAALAVYRSGQ